MTSTKPKNLALADEIPAEIIYRLRDHVPLLKRIQHSEEFSAHQPIIEIVRELDAICESEGIIGVHYTRGIRERISSQGLLTRSGAERRTEFLEMYGHRFTDAQRERLIAGCTSYFDEQQNRVRNGRIWFNLTRAAMSNGSAEPLLSHYGGEVVYKPFSGDEEIEAVLCSLGEPMIVECSLRPDSLRKSCEYPWGRIWLSSYHCTVNPEAVQWDVDLYSQESVPPAAILKIEGV